jgi:predicted DNA-binding transcriptional regulator YafY
LKRTGRLIELLSLLNTQKSFTVKELAQYFSVSRRTMLRDLHLLSESGVPLQASPGPGGGYSLIRNHQLPPLSLTMEEAVALIISYESILHYAEKLFEKETLSVIAKLMAIIPPETMQKVEQMRQKVRINNPRRVTEPLFLRPLLDAALARQCVEIEYDSLQRRSRRVIQPDYLYAFHGYWYCRCYCFLRERSVSLRVDRIKAFTIVEDHPRHEIEEVDNNEESACLPLRIQLTSKGCKLADYHHEMSNLIRYQEDGSGVIDTFISSTDIEWITRFVLGLGKEAIVEQPDEVIACLQAELSSLRERYSLSPKHTRSAAILSKNGVKR